MQLISYRTVSLQIHKNIQDETKLNRCAKIVVSRVHDIVTGKCNIAIFVWAKLLCGDKLLIQLRSLQF